MDTAFSDLHSCFRCNLMLHPGACCYRVRIEIEADFDGYIDGDALLADASAAANALGAAEMESAESLSNDVYQKFEVLLCRPCKDKLLITAFSSIDEKAS